MLGTKTIQLFAFVIFMYVHNKCNEYLMYAFSRLDLCILDNVSMLAGQRPVMLFQFHADNLSQ